LRLIVGLGNPGLRYVLTRHNLGWLVVDRLLDGLPRKRAQLKFSSEISGPHFINTYQVLVMKPLTYMNLSGKAVREALETYDIAPSDILVIFDDVDLPFGTLRFRSKGSAGGHKGMASVVLDVGTCEIPRLRLGIGSPAGNMVDHVLSTFTDNESRELPGLLDIAVDAARIWVSDDEEKVKSYLASHKVPGIN